ncbi:MAG: bifunctional metallophosphatase/5'-nucleotidase [Dehalococcoidia bacterium]|nr:bifunctional metallophosphatase/5'-nucleotidase [Dehalococcoidia bacterium]
MRTMLLAVTVLAAALALLPALDRDSVLPSVGAQDGGEVTLTLLHNNDGESTLLPLTNTVEIDGAAVEVPVAGIAAFKAVIDREIAGARARGNAVMAVYAGDVFLSSAAFICGQREGSPFFDAVAQSAIPYDAHVIGNHEFDATPDVLERFIRSFEGQPFLSANLDFSGEPGFADLVDDDGLIELPVADGRVIGRSMVVEDPITGARFGLVGATTPGLATISIPRNVTVTPDLAATAAAVQSEIDRLLERGVNKIIFVSHLQSVAADVEIVALLHGVDITVSGGGHYLLQNPAVDASLQVLPGERAPVEGHYPLEASDADGKTVYIVTTAGNYKYAGRLDAVFDAAGEVTSIVAASSYPRPVVPESEAAAAAGFTSAVTPDLALIDLVEDPVAACLADLASTTIATTEVLLDVSRTGLRGGESNAGNLVADSFLHAYDRIADSLGLPARGPGNPVVAIQNSGGIRQNAGDTLPTSGVAPGEIFLVNTLDVLPFPNAVSVVRNTSPTDLKAAFEVSGARYPAPSGAFLQISGITAVYDPSRSPGDRVVSLTLADGAPIVADGAVVEGAPTVTVVTSSFIADGGDGYTVLGNNPDKLQITASYEQALREYLQALGTVSAADPRYAPGGEGRSVFLEPVAEVPASEEDSDEPAPPATGAAPASGNGFPSPALVALLAFALAGVLGAAGARRLRRR